MTIVLKQSLKASSYGRFKRFFINLIIPVIFLIAMDTYYLQELQELNHSRYIENGFKNRTEYLNTLRDQYGKEAVDGLLTVLPPSEDFDGLVIELEDLKYV